MIVPMALRPAVDRELVRRNHEVFVAAFSRECFTPPEAWRAYAHARAEAERYRKRLRCLPRSARLENLPTWLEYEQLRAVAETARPRDWDRALWRAHLRKERQRNEAHPAEPTT